MSVKNYTEILAWQKAHELVLMIYKAIKYLPDIEKFNLISQMVRAAVSVAANIVEGFNRTGLQDSLRFYNTSHASLEELKYHIYLCKDLNYFNQKQYDYLLNLTEEASKTLHGWVQSQIKNKK